MTATARIRAFIGPPMENGCRFWLGYREPRGYGMVRFGGKKNQRAHRVVWELIKGPIPTGLHVLHRCDNRACVEIGHLFLGVNRDNVDDKVAKGRQHRGEAVPSSKLTADQVRLIYRDDRPSNILAIEFGVTPTSIRRIRRGKSWQHATVSQ